MASALETTTLISQGERIAKLENNQQHLATKADISEMQATLTWRMVIAVSIATAILGLLIRVP